MRYAVPIIVITLLGIPSSMAQTLFEDRPGAGVNVTHTGMAIVNDDWFGSGAAWFDYDRDGDLDLYMTQRLGANHLFRNNGDGTFTDVAAELGADDAAHDGAGVAVADYDNDGDLDIYLANADEDVLLRNEGGTSFTDVTASAFGGIVLDQRGTSASWGDYDRDGYLDLYVAHHKHLEDRFLDHHDYLFHNNGDGTFTDVSDLLDRSQLNGFGFIGVWTDYDDDGDLDLFLVNDCLRDGLPNRLFRNDNGIDGTNWLFSEVSAEVGVEVCENGMGLAVGDYNRDALLDYLMTNNFSSVLFKNLGGTFEDATKEAGIFDNFVDSTGHHWQTWGTNFFDMNLDGWPDLFLAAGSLHLSVEDNPQPNQVWRNDGDGTFTDFAGLSGLDDPNIGRTSVYGDYDGDGDADLFLVNYGGEAHLYENVEANATGHHWLIVDLEGVASNRDGIGARVTVETNDGVVQVAETHSGTSLGGGDDLGAYFGLGTATGVDRLEVRWPSGLVQVLEAVAVDQRLTVVESGLLAELRPLTWPIEIGASGGSFSYRLGVTNLTGASVEVDVWLHIEGPEGVSITRGPIHRTLGGGASLGLTGSQNVPGGAPSGSYTMTLKVGTFPIAEQTASFSFSKAGTAARR
ncbi:MAG: RNA-binding protein [Rhodothermaceae bacterium]|nr:MAG: RNA-binding protein [Rhodothermaceae bacterium]